VDKYSEENILSFLTDLVGHEKITLQTDILFDLGVIGDDFHEMIEKYQKTFNVDMTTYLWYFHSDEEGQSIGGGFFKAPYERVKRIPVTPKMLLDFANKGKWTIEYPEHTLPKRRYDLIINTVLVLGFFIFLTIYLLKKYVFN
jgi:hypothetical protein